MHRYLQYNKIKVYSQLQDRLSNTNIHRSTTHCSPESNLVNFGPPKKPTTDLECSWHGDFGSEVGVGTSSSATETVISL